MKDMRKIIFGLGAALVLSAWIAGFTLADTDTQRVARDQTEAAALPILPAQLYNYADLDLPQHYERNPVANRDNTPDNNPVTDEGATLGRVLFYDTVLSANSSIACASCHLQDYGFSDPNRFSIGFEGGLTGRNSMGLSNARFYESGRFFWDERAETLEHQVLMPIQDSVEMGLTLAELEARVAAQPYYAGLFTAAFGSDDVTSERISLALAQFVRSMVSYQSKYDIGVQEDFDNFTQQENEGRQIFFGRGNCSECHETDAFVLDRPRNIGLDLVYADQGLGNVTGDEDDNGKFKVPSLRNIALTGPYMHDGRFETLDEVVAFYNNGIEAHPNLDQRLSNNNGQPRRLRLDANERAALVAFLNTLTDLTFVNAPKYSDPFMPAPSHELFIPLFEG